MDFTGKKILLVEDDSTLNFIICDHLSEAGYEVTETNDGEKAFKIFTNESFDLCLFDVMLPKLDGFSLAKKIRETNQVVPILFLTAKSLPEDKINGFTLGADDYITKPFRMDELLMRIKVFLKRSQPLDSFLPEVKSCKVGKFDFYYDNLTLLDQDTCKILTYKEAQLLKYFCEHSNTVLNRSEILKNVWGSDDYYLGRSLDVFISRLRKYLNGDPDIKILNIHGIGFRFNATIKTQ
ncbi:MAG: response regulator transcription factor [Prolixibacteraceae bacterium]